MCYILVSASFSISSGPQGLVSGRSTIAVCLECVRLEGASAGGFFGIRCSCKGRGGLLFRHSPSTNPQNTCDGSIVIKILLPGMGSQYQPWYKRRSCPIFCAPCVPAYLGVRPAQRCVFMTGAVLFAVGVMILLGLLLTCVAVECINIAGALLPFAIILIIVGILLMHCGWAAHLLNDEGTLTSQTTTTHTQMHRDPAGPDHEEEEGFALCDAGYSEEGPNVRTGFWQFDEKTAWQTVANPYPIQSTLKPTLERLPY
uniref:Transmembrane protein n=3 Tax=Steinernema glaseri TaxID=37863 RepID=A0A1I8AIW8_9BILA